MTVESNSELLSILWVYVSRLHAGFNNFCTTKLEQLNAALHNLQLSELSSYCFVAFVVFYAINYC